MFLNIKAILRELCFDISVTDNNLFGRQGYMSYRKLLFRKSKKDVLVIYT